MIIEFELNGRVVTREIEPGATLSTVLRDSSQFSVKHGCATGDCGACTVLLDGQPINSCVVAAGRIQGQMVTTLEGLLDDPMMLKLQAALVECGAVQCGYCSPGMLITLYAHFIHESDQLNEDSLRHAMTGNLCRCTGYVKHIEAALNVAQSMSSNDNHDSVDGNTATEAPSASNNLEGK